MGALSWQHLLIVLLIVLVLFGGSRLAGLGKSTGRAIKEFKDETKGLRDQRNAEAEQVAPPAASGQSQVTPVNELPASNTTPNVQNTTPNTVPAQAPETVDYHGEPRRDA